MSGSSIAKPGAINITREPITRESKVSAALTNRPRSSTEFLWFTVHSCSFGVTGFLSAGAYGVGRRDVVLRDRSGAIEPRPCYRPILLSYETRDTP